jgi:hypothetical protein
MACVTCSRGPMSMTGMVGSVLAVSALGIVGLWVLPSLLTRHPSQGISAAQRLASVNAVRATTVTFLVAVGAGAEDV